MLTRRARRRDAGSLRSLAAAATLRSSIALLAISPGALAGSPGDDLPALTIDVRPRIVYRGCVVRARARLGAESPGLVPSAPTGGPRRKPLPDDAEVRWTAASGLLFSDDLPEVEWRAPAKDGPTRLKVEVVLCGRTVGGELAVDVRAPSTGDMVWIPPGPFLRGDIRGTRDTREVKTIQNSSDEPFQTVDLDGFWIDRHPVTNEKYRAFLEDAIEQGIARAEEVAVMGEFEGSWVPFYYFKPYERLIHDMEYKEAKGRKPQFCHDITFDGSRFHIRPGKEDCPVVDVTWFGSAAYVRFYGKSLPTEAQWEKAARGGDGRRFPWGDGVPTAYHVNLDHQLGDELLPVGSFSPQGDSPYGVADMVSGAFEWTNDWYNPDYYQDNFSETPLREPAGPFWGRAHSIRGSPSILRFPKATVDGDEPVSFRYSWIYEFVMGDPFANGLTAFRGAISPDAR